MLLEVIVRERNTSGPDSGKPPCPETLGLNVLSWVGTSQKSPLGSRGARASGSEEEEVSQSSLFVLRPQPRPLSLFSVVHLLLHWLRWAPDNDHLHPLLPAFPLARPHLHHPPLTLPLPVLPCLPGDACLDAWGYPTPPGRPGVHNSSREPRHGVGDTNLPGGAPGVGVHILRSPAAGPGQSAVLRRYSRGFMCGVPWAKAEAWVQEQFGEPTAGSVIYI